MRFGKNNVFQNREFSIFFFKNGFEKCSHFRFVFQMKKKCLIPWKAVKGSLVVNFRHTRRFRQSFVAFLITLNFTWKSSNPLWKNFPVYLKFTKVRTFWETHKIWKNLPHGFDESANNHEEDFFKLCVLLKKSELYPRTFDCFSWD